MTTIQNVSTQIWETLILTSCSACISVHLGHSGEGCNENGSGFVTKNCPSPFLETYFI